MLAAGALAAITTGIHLAAGHVDPVRPLLSSSLAEAPKRTLHACWHMASIVQASSAVVLLYLAFNQVASANALARFIAINYLGFGLVFLTVTLSVDWPRRLVRLPKWAFFLLVAGLAGAATLR
jgi:hypothetical protein